MQDEYIIFAPRIPSPMVRGRAIVVNDGLREAREVAFEFEDANLSLDCVGFGDDTRRGQNNIGEPSPNTLLLNAGAGVFLANRQ